MTDPNVEIAKQKTNRLYQERTPALTRLWENTLGRTPGLLGQFTDWVAEKLSGHINKETTQKFFPAAMAIGAGLLTFITTGTGLGTWLGMGVAALIGFSAFTMLTPDRSTGTKLRVNAPGNTDLVRQQGVDVPALSKNGEIIAKNETVPAFQREYTTPPNIKWPELMVVKTDDLAKGGKLEVGTAGAIHIYQNWEEGVRKIHDLTRDYKVYTRDAITHHLGTLGLNEQDLKTWNAVPEVPTPPKLLAGNDDVNHALNQVGMKLFKDQGWEKWNVSTKLNHLNEFVAKYRNKTTQDMENARMEIAGAYCNSMISSPATQVYNEMCKAKRAHNPDMAPSLANALDLHDQLSPSGRWGNIKNLVLAKSTERELASFEKEFHGPNREALERFAAKGGVMDQYNQKVASLQGNFDTLARSVQDTGMAVLKFVPSKDVASVPGEGYVVVKDLTQYQFGKPETGITRTLAVIKNTKGQYVVSGWKQGDQLGTDWTLAANNASPVLIENPADAMQIAKATQMINVIAQAQTVQSVTVASTSDYQPAVTLAANTAFPER